MPALHHGFAALLPFDREEAPLDVAYWIELERRISRPNLLRWLEERLPLLPHAQEVIESPRGWFGLPSWQPAPRFVVAQHTHAHPAASSPEEAARRWLAPALSRRFPAEQPRWQLHHGDCGKHGTVLLLRHHLFWADPANEAAWLNGLLAPQPKQGARVPSTAKTLPSNPVDGPLRAPSRALAMVEGLWKRWQFAKDPLEPVRKEVDAFATVARLALRPWPPMPFNGSLSGRRHATWCRFPLPALRTIRNRLGGSSWEILIASALGGLDALLAQRVLDRQHASLVALLPVAVGSEQDAQRTGRRVSLGVAKLPLRFTDPVERLRAVSAAAELLRLSGASEQISAGLRWLSALVLMGGENILRQQLRSLALHTYFWPFPPLRERRYVAGIPVRQIAALPPPIANLGLVFGLLTYAEDAVVSMVADPERACDLAQLRKAVEQTFWELVRIAEGEQPLVREQETRSP